MKKWIVGGIILLCGLAWRGVMEPGKGPLDPVAGVANPVGQKEIRTAVGKSLPLLASSSHTFLENSGGCHSCHGQGLGMIAFGMAKEKGFAVNEEALREAIDTAMNAMNRMRFVSAESTDPQGLIIGDGYDMWGLSVNQYPVNKALLLSVRDLMQRQTGQGSWIPTGLRPPLEYYPFSGTALVIRAMQAYAGAEWPEEVARRTRKAADWLSRTEAKANEERAFQLLGLVWAGVSREEIAAKAKELSARQRADGGWSQLDSLSSDAYATGQSLFALNQSGQLGTGELVYQRGLAFLLRTQSGDGSWEVKSRTIPTIPYTPSGFPHGDNQFISAAGTNWAVMAMVLAAEKD